MEDREAEIERLKQELQQLEQQEIDELNAKISKFKQNNSTVSSTAATNDSTVFTEQAIIFQEQQILEAEEAELNEEEKDITAEAEELDAEEEEFVKEEQQVQQVAMVEDAIAESAGNLINNINATSETASTTNNITALSKEIAEEEIKEAEHEKVLIDEQIKETELEEVEEHKKIVEIEDTDKVMEELEDFLDSTDGKGTAEDIFDIAFELIQNITETEEIAAGKTSETAVMESRYPNCEVYFKEWLGDSECDYYFQKYNTEECGWDGGDCCMDTNDDLDNNDHCMKNHTVIAEILPMDEPDLNIVEEDHIINDNSIFHWNGHLTPDRALIIGIGCVLTALWLVVAYCLVYCLCCRFSRSSFFRLPADDFSDDYTLDIAKYHTALEIEEKTKLHDSKETKEAVSIADRFGVAAGEQYDPFPVKKVDDADEYSGDVSDFNIDEELSVMKPDKKD